MLNLQTITPLWGETPRVDRFIGLTITEVSNQALASLALRKGREDEGRKAVEAMLGFALPDVGRHTAAGSYAASWFAQDQWLISAETSEHELMPFQLVDAVAGLASVTEQSDGWCRFDLEGMCRGVFERLSGVNLTTMEDGSATRALLEHLSCVVICFETARHYSVLGPRSYARSLHHALVTAARSAL